MKKLFFAVALGTSALFFAQEAKTKTVGPPAGNAIVGDVYGSSVSENAEKSAISIKKLDKQLKKANKVENVIVKGEVVDVCEKKGCWLTIKTENDERFFVKMKDYAFFVPTALKGKTVVMEGKAENKEISVNELKHYAEDAKKSQAEIDKITKPENETRFLASGIKVVN